MGLFRSIGARKDASRGTAAIEVRKSLANLFTGAGVLPGAASPLVAGTAAWAYTVRAAGFVSTRGASDGVHLFGNDGTVTIGATGVGSTVPVAPGSGLQRIDIAWVLHPSASENSDTISEPSFGVTSGAAASTASPPTIPTGALEIARNLMLSTATSTASTGNSITQTATAAVLKVGSTTSGAGTLSATTTETAFTGCTLTLPAGTWDLDASAWSDWSTGGGTPPRWAFRLRQGSTAGTELDRKELYIGSHEGSVPVALATSGLVLASATVVMLTAVVTGPATGTTLGRNGQIRATRRL